MMINLRLFFKSNPYLLPVSKAQKEALERFAINKKEFELWLSPHQPQRVKFQFYFHTAIDFYFEEFKLFTAFFKRTSTDYLELQQLKMTKANHNSICQTNWKPFEEVIMDFLNALEEKNKAIYFSETKPLHEYAAICDEGAITDSNPQPLATNISTAMARG